MVLTWEMRSPRLRSPEELRAFYAIALRPKIDVMEVDLVTDFLDRGAQSCDSTSLFSSQAPTASSATSISDIKTPAALSIGPPHGAATGQLAFPRSHSPCMPDVYPSVSGIDLVSKEENANLELQSYQTVSGLARFRNRIGGELSFLKSHQLNST
jgi:hypothetical protein